MKNMLLLPFIFLVLLTACDDNSFNKPQELRFSGVGEYWDAIFIQEYCEGWEKNNNNNNEYSNESNNSVILTYKDFNINSDTIQVIEVEFESPHKNGSANEIKQIDNYKGMVTYKLGSSKNGTIIRDYETIKLHVKWNNGEETIELTAVEGFGRKINL